MVPSVVINLADSLKRPAIGGGQASAAEAGSVAVEVVVVEVVVEEVVVEVAGAVAAEEAVEGADGDVSIRVLNAAEAET